MELVPPTPSVKQIAAAGKYNLAEAGVEFVEPNRVVMGYTPSGAASCDEVADTVFIGAESLAGEREAEIDFEHETIHYTQFSYLWEEVGEDFHAARHEIEKRALGNAIETLQDRDYVDTLVGEGHVNYYNFEVMLALASGETEVLEQIDRMKTGRERHIDSLENIYRQAEREILPEDSSQDGWDDELDKVGALTMKECAELARKHGRWSSENALATFEFGKEFREYVENRWEAILESPSTSFAEPVIERYLEQPEKRDDIMEAQAMFWSFFREGFLEEVEEYGSSVYPGELEEQLGCVHDSYSHQPWYDHGDNVRNELESRIEVFRERTVGGEDPYSVAADIVNKDYSEFAG